MFRSLTGTAVLITVFGAPATGLAGSACDEISTRVNGHGPGALRAIWREFGVRSRLFEEPGGGSLRAMRRDLARPDLRQGLVILDVTDTASEDWQHLIFLRTGGRCRFVGAVDAPAQGGEPPTLRLVPLPAGHVALAVRARVRTGTGLALHRETWYLMSTGGPEQARRTMALSRVLDYPARGHMVGWPSTFDRSFSTRLQAREEADEVRIDFIATYTSGSYIYWMPVEPLFTARRTAIYTWKPNERRFVLDPIRSDVDDDEIEGIFHDAEEQFLRHNVRDLAPLAGRANERQRAWLRHFLDTVADSPEKRDVLESFR